MDAIKTAGPRMAGVGRMWAMAVGGGLLTLGGLPRLINGVAASLPATNDTAYAIGALLGALTVWLLGMWLIQRTAYHLARYKGRPHRLWMGLALFFSLLLGIGWLPLIVLALLPKRRVDAEAAQAVGSNALDGQLAHLAELHAAGVLSAEEFAQAKQRLLVP